MRYSYDDLDIAIHSVGKRRFAARVLRSPLGEIPETVFGPPLTAKELKAVLEARKRKRGARKPPPPREQGERLFRALFSGDLLDLLRRCRALISDDGGNGTERGLRLRLRLSLGDPERGYLAALPWELLRDPEGGFHLATELATPVVRDVIAPRRGKPRRCLTVERPLRILVVDAAPRTMHELNLKLELERMQEALKELCDNGHVELLRLDEPTLAALRTALREETVHVLHFMGHGGYAADSGYGALFFETPSPGDERGDKHQVDGEHFASHLTDCPELRLVFLTACKSARYGGRVGSPYHGVAARLIEHTGVPAVIANQHSISDKAAIELATLFYQRIAAGDDVDTAVSEIRKQFQPTSDEWATPVLFLSAPDGKLFDIQGAASSRSGVTVIGGTRAEPEPLHVGIRSFLGSDGTSWGGDLEEESDLYLDLTEHFDPDSPDGRIIRTQSLWQEEVYPRVRCFLLDAADKGRPLLLDLAAHATVAFAAGYVLEAKSGLDIRICQRTLGKPLDWRPDDGRLPDVETLWQRREDVVLAPDAPDVAVAASISNPDLLGEVKKFVRDQGQPVGRIVDATIAPEPGQRSVAGGEHALRLAQKLVPRARVRRPAERSGRIHLFLSGPNAFAFYLGQLSGALGSICFYEYPFRIPGGFSRYSRSLELPPPEEAYTLPEGW